MPKKKYKIQCKKCKAIRYCFAGQKIFNDNKFSDGFVNFIRTQQKADVVKLIDEMLINRPKPAVMSDNHYKEHILHTTECPLCRFDREILMNLKSKVKEMK